MKGSDNEDYNEVLNLDSIDSSGKRELKQVKKRKMVTPSTSQVSSDIDQSGASNNTY